MNDDQWEFVDEMLRLNQTLSAIQFVKQSTSGHLKEAIDATYNRKQKIGVDFTSSARARVAAFTALNKVVDPICVIEGSWDGDSGGWFIILIAIVERPSQQHPKYTQYGLCNIRGYPGQVERAQALGEELAQAADTTYYLTSVEVDDEKRWWDME